MEKSQATAALVKKAIKVFEKSLAGKKNITVSELVRLLELQKEIDKDDPKDITVTWVEPGKKE